MYLLQLQTIINHHQQTIINQQQMPIINNHKLSIEFILKLMIYLRDKQ